MVIAAAPDTLGAVVERLKSFAEITPFVMTNAGYTSDATDAQRARPRIATVVQSFWQLGAWPLPPTGPKGSFALVVSGPVGSPGGVREAGVDALRVDLHCYGPNPYEANRLYRQVHPCLCPTAQQGVAESFTQSGVRFLTVDREAGPIAMVEPDTRYCKTVASYVFRFMELSA